MSRLNLVVALFAGASAVLAALYTSDEVNRRVRIFGCDEYQTLASLIDNGRSMEPFMTEHARTRFDIQYVGIFWEILKMAVRQDQTGIALFLLERVAFDEQQLPGPGMRDRILSTLLELALAYRIMTLFRTLWFQDFEYWHIPYTAQDWQLGISGYILTPLHTCIVEEDMEEMKQLITSNHRRAAEMIPGQSTLIRLLACSAMRAIDLAQFCTTVSPAAAAKFNPTQMLHGFILSNYLSDADMLQVSGRLCELGAEVTQEMLDTLAQQHPDNVETFAALKAEREAQNEIKESEME
jgi:hypothetical protein